MRKIFFIFITIIICDNEIPLSPEVSTSYYGIKENHIYSYGNFSYVNQLTERNLIYSDAIFFNNIITRKFNSFVQGDINEDGIINILDIVLIVNMILGDDVYNNLADLNSDGIINILDIVQLVNIILN